MKPITDPSQIPDRMSEDEVHEWFSTHYLTEECLEKMAEVPLDERPRPRNHGVVVCVDNSGYPASLELGKQYWELLGGTNQAGLIRIIDESGDDYLYSAERFRRVSN
jgi:hypothetical protein